MKYRVINPEAVALRLDPGDDYHECIEKVFAELEWPSGFIWGLGSVENPVLAHYKISDKKYTEMPMPGIFELASMNGTAAQLNGNLSIHLHVVISDEEMNAYGGHLVQGKCSATAEIVIRNFGKKMKKKLSEESGLNAWDFE